MNDADNRRETGVLLPLTMLPGPFGVGVLGAEARTFADTLRSGGFSMWQMLPIEHLGESFSPYKCVSAFAGDPIFIDPRWLLERGWVSESELDARCEGLQAHTVNYERVYDRQMVLLRAAFSRLPDRVMDEINRFNPFWLDEYVLYMALRERHNMAPWYEWPDASLRRHEPRAIERARVEYRGLMSFYRFTQWVFDIQWKSFKDYTNRRGIKLIGDIPFYVSEDSAEAWSRREMFDADSDGAFTAVAGAPPDYFTPDGQRWGNPLYNWDYMESTNYEWWTGRMRAALDRFDSVRIDHFRGFESFWRIPAECPSAKDGKWVKGPGFKPFKAMTEALGPLPVIAEDLGTIGPEVEALLDQTGYPGMRVLQFGFLGDDRHLPHRYEENKVAYTGTHDNTTLLAWMYDMRSEDRTRALLYSGYEGDWGKGGPNCGICRAWIRALYMSKARKVIVPVQDLLGFGSDTRTNTPGIPVGNWRFRVTGGDLEKIDWAYYKLLGELTERVGGVKSGE